MCRTSFRFDGMTKARVSRRHVPDRDDATVDKRATLGQVSSSNPGEAGVCKSGADINSSTKVETIESIDPQAILQRVAPSGPCQISISLANRPWPFAFTGLEEHRLSDVHLACKGQADATSQDMVRKLRDGLKAGRRFEAAAQDGEPEAMLFSLQAHALRRHALTCTSSQGRLSTGMLFQPGIAPLRHACKFQS